jgi:hypothetical protein
MNRLATAAQILHFDLRDNKRKKKRELTRQQTWTLCTRGSMSHNALHCFNVSENLLNRIVKLHHIFLTIIWIIVNAIWFQVLKLVGKLKYNFEFIWCYLIFDTENLALQEVAHPQNCSWFYHPDGRHHRGRWNRRYLNAFYKAKTISNNLLHR